MDFFCSDDLYDLLIRPGLDFFSLFSSFLLRMHFLIDKNIRQIEFTSKTNFCFDQGLADKCENIVIGLATAESLKIRSCKPDLKFQNSSCLQLH